MRRATLTDLSGEGGVKGLGLLERTPATLRAGGDRGREGRAGGILKEVIFRLPSCTHKKTSYQRLFYSGPGPSIPGVGVAGALNVEV